VTAGKGGGKRSFYMSLVVILVGGIAVLSYMATRPALVAQVDTTIKPIPNQGHAIGSDSAPVEVVEFGDFECPACGSFANLTEPDVRARLVLTGRVRFRFMDLPLNIHHNTWSAHMAAWCAGEQGRFWEMHDALYQSQDRWNTEATRRPEKYMSELARQVGVGMEQYDQCMSTEKYRPQVRSNMEEATRFGVSSTPTFIFGSRRYPGVMPYDEFRARVDSMITEAKATKGTKKAK
jgi:protein-disulfide isomerase